MGHDLETTPGGHTPNPDRERGDALQETVGASLHVLLRLANDLQRAAERAPHLRIGNRPLTALAADAFGVQRELDAGHRAYLEGAVYRRAAADECCEGVNLDAEDCRANDDGTCPAACLYCRGGGAVVPVVSSTGLPVPCRRCGGTGKEPE